MNWLTHLFACPRCPLHLESIAFLKNELRMAQEREKQAVNSLLDAKGLGQIHVERREITDEERQKLQAQEEKSLEDAQALFKDQGHDTNERLVEV